MVLISYLTRDTLKIWLLLGVRYSSCLRGEIDPKQGQLSRTLLIFRNVISCLSVI